MKRLLYFFLLFSACVSQDEDNICCVINNIQITGNHIDKDHYDDGVILFIPTSLTNNTKDTISLIPGYMLKHYTKQLADSLNTRPFLKYNGSVYNLKTVPAYGWEPDDIRFISPKSNEKIYFGILDEELSESCLPDCKSFLNEVMRNSNFYLVTMEYDTIKCKKSEEFNIVWNFSGNDIEVMK